MTTADLRNILTCPCDQKHELLRHQDGAYLCKRSDCPHSEAEHAFRVIKESIVLISELKCDTVCEANSVNSYVKRSNPSKWRNFLKSLLVGTSKTTIENCALFVKTVLEAKPNPTILVVGSGERGSGTEGLYSAKDITIIGTDIYASETVNVVADAHYLPFKDQVFDGVWIQAVLEHVVDPQLVVAEIARVLKANGIIYAETPFMQQVHEGAYDFTRFTVLGHRYLFKNFSMIKMGGNKGVGTALTWSIRYFFWAVFRSRGLARVIAALVGGPLRALERIADKRSLYDASSGVFFMGRKSETAITHRDLITLYRGLQ